MLMDLLVLLAENAGEVVSKEEILDRLWKTRFVAESALSRNIADLRRLLGDSDRHPRYIETVPKRGYRLIAAIERGRLFAQNRLAVLPFQNLSSNPEQEYLADGIADLLTTELAKISSLHVISRQSVLHLKGSTQKVPEIGRDLNVDAIVEGSVLSSAERLRINVQLIRVDSQEHLWAERYDCGLSDLLKVQAEVAQAIARAIQAALTPADLNRLARAPAVNPEAHADYLRARYYFTRGTLPELQKGAACLQSSLAKDPGYAPAWAELAIFQCFLGFWGFVPHQPAIARMREAAEKALTLDNNLSEAHVAMAWLEIFDWNWDAAENEFRCALDLNRNSVAAHNFYGMFLGAVRNDAAAALAEAEAMLALDPLSPWGNSGAGWTILFGGDYERAASQASRTLEMYPEAIHALYVLGSAELAQSRYREAAAAFERVTLISPADSMARAMLGHVYARLGRRDAVVDILEELRAKQQREYVPDLNFVFLYAALGDLDQAFAWLEKCCRDREPKMFSIRVGPLLDPLRKDARFDEMVRCLGLADAAHRPRRT